MGVRKMNPQIQDILKGLEDFNKSPEGHALDLRLNLADLIIAKLKEKGWTQSQLAQKTKWKDSFISRLVHADENFTTETEARVLHALGIEPALTEKTSTTAPIHRWLRWAHGTSEDSIPVQKETDTIDDQENFKIKKQAQSKTQIEITCTAG